MAKKYIDADILRAEIERRNLANYCGTAEQYEEELLSLLDTIPEQSVEGLEEAAEKYRRKSCNAALRPNVDGPTPEYGGSVKDAFIAGAEWMKNKMMEGAVEGVVCYGSKGAYVESDFLGEYNTDVYGNPGDKVRVIVIKED